jgi:uncharacterized protein (DUF983 family)
VRPGHVARILSRALRQRCPLCGQGRLFRTAFQLHHECPVCGLRFERERGYFVGGMELHWIATFAAGCTLYLVLEPWLPSGPWGLLEAFMPLVTGLSLLLYRPARSFWMGLDNLFDPVEDEYVELSRMFDDERPRAA